MLANQRYELPFIGLHTNELSHIVTSQFCACPKKIEESKALLLYPALTTAKDEHVANSEYERLFNGEMLSPHKQVDGLTWFHESCACVVTD